MGKYTYDTLGLMIDMSRNAVMSVAQVKEYLSYLKKMGYNCAMLYTEDTYEVQDEPYFGYMRGGYSAEDLRELDSYAASLGIELVPCIQTLAHLQGFVHWKKVPVDIDDIMMVGEERVYELIENMIKSVRACFKTRRIHIGMDEAWKLGRGKYLDKNGYESSTAIIKKHLERVLELVKKYDFEPMIWSDMFFYDLSDARKYYLPRMEIPQAVKDSVPENVTLVYWDYYQESVEPYDAMLYNHEQLTDKLWFAASAWSGHGFLPLNRYSMLTMRCGLTACRKHGVKHLLQTTWGDDGNECARYALLPSLYAFAEYARGNEDEEKIKRGFQKMFGAEMEDFLSLDDLNDIMIGLNSRTSAAPKIALYNDLFNGLLDCRVDPAKTAYIAEVAQRWHALAKKYRKWGYLFDTAAKLADALAIKYDLGVRTRAAYQAGDKEALRLLAQNEYAELLRRIKCFMRAFEKQWYRENNPTGFDVQEIRLGGLLCRVDSCRRRLLAYAKGEIDEIPELAVTILERDIPDGTHKTYGMVVTPNRLTHKVH